MKRLLVLLPLLLSALQGTENDLSFDYELDPYYSNVSAFFQIGDEPVIDGTDVPEYKLYSELMLDSWKPNTFIVEAALHPAALAGVAYRNVFPTDYEHAEINTLDVNLIHALTAGFEEPYALSLFIGRMVIFNQKGAEHIGGNRAYAGYLLSVGDYSIKDNRAIYNQWVNVEAKLKGTRDIDEHTLDWSFRVGAKINKNPDFADSVYIGARRSRIDFFKGIWSWVYNSGFDVMAAVSTDDFELIHAQAVFEKSWPLDAEEKITFGLEFGYMYEGNGKYRGSLYEEGVTNHRLILRPNLSF